MQPVLEKLGLTDVNDGVFDGEWRGGGAKIDKISPIDGRRARQCAHRIGRRLQQGDLHARMKRS